MGLIQMGFQIGSSAKLGLMLHRWTSAICGALSNDKQARAAHHAAASKREAEDKAATLRMEYLQFRRLQADRVFAGLPPRERAAIEAAARAKTSRGTGKVSLAQIMIDIERVRVTAEKYPAKIISFEQWQQRHSRQ